METYEIKRKLKKKIKNNAKGLFKILQKVHQSWKTILNIPVTFREYGIVKKQLKNINDDAKKILYVGIPLHPNLGDQAQYYCILKWSEINYPDSVIIEVPDCLINSNLLGIVSNKLKKIIKDTDIIFFQSGYRTSDIANYRGEYAHRKILDYFPNNPIIVFPQTVNFANEKEAGKSKEAYSKGKKVLFLARDKKSYDTAKNLYTKNSIDLYPDIVTSLIGKYKYNNERNGILCCLRRDAEKFYENDELEKMIDKLKKIYNVSRNDTTINVSYKTLKENLKDILEKTFEDFSKYKVIITDRYHGTIFSLISNTPTIVLGSTDHKLSSGVDWFKGISGFEGYIYYAKNLEEAIKLANDLYNRKYIYSLPEYFSKKYYDKLKEKFEEETGSVNR